MGSHATRTGLDELRAAYDALENKRSRQGAAMRKRIKALETQESAGGGPSANASSSVGAATLPTDDPAGIARPTLSESATNAATLTVEPGWEPPPAIAVPESAPSDTEKVTAPDLTRLVKTERRAVYWIGVIPAKNAETGEGKPPQHQIDNIGGNVSFHEYWTPYEGMGQDGSPRRGQYLGHLVTLKESQVADIRRALGTAIVRWRTRSGRFRHGYVMQIPTADDVEEQRKRWGLNDREVSRIKIRADQFELRDTDEWAARYVYCVKVDGPEAQAGSTWRPSTTCPPSVEQMGRIEGP